MADHRDLYSRIEQVEGIGRTAALPVPEYGAAARRPQAGQAHGLVGQFRADDNAGYPHALATRLGP